ncbi:MAG: hypothetical protein AB1545_01175 [Thermodesulfobacteriota bacterium]
MILKKQAIRIFQEFSPWLLAAVTVLAGNLAATYLWMTFEAWAKGQWGEVSWLGRCYVVFFFLMAWVLFKQRDKFFPPRTRYFRNEKAQKRKHLVLFLSISDHDLAKTGIPEKIRLQFQSLAEDIALIKKKKIEEKIRWNWEMPLRAINHHLGVLTTVNICCSSRSFAHVHFFLNICKRYQELAKVKFLLLVQKECHPVLVNAASLNRTGQDCQPENFSGFSGFDFENFDDLTDALLLLISKYESFENDIMIDITGGQKPTSIVGAAVTFNQKIKAQYIQTEGENEVLSYDVVLSPKLEAGV